MAGTDATRPPGAERERSFNVTGRAAGALPLPPLPPPPLKPPPLKPPPPAATETSPLLLLLLSARAASIEE